MDFEDAGALTLEGSCALLLAVVAFKLYRLKCNSHSRCCGEHVDVELSNPGVGVVVREWGLVPHDHI